MHRSEPGLEPTMIGDITGVDLALTPLALPKRHTAALRLS
jgi:hypothetical protein